MRNLTSFTLVVVFAAGLLLTSTPAHAQNLGSVETKSGMQVAAQVEGLRRDNLNVNAALQQFERRGHRPKSENATSISGTIERVDKGARNERGFAIRKANFAQTIRDGSIELIFVPVLETFTEWQGTLIARLYNQYNQVAAEEVFNLVMVQESTGRWLPVYELSFLNGYPYVHYQPGMYAAFALGVLLSDHPVVTGAAPSRVYQAWQRGDAAAPCIGCMPASYRMQTTPQDRFPGRCLNQGSRCNNVLGTINNVDSWLGVMGGRVRQTAHDAFPMCASGGVISMGSLGRFGTICGAQLIYQAGRHIFRIW